MSSNNDYVNKTNAGRPDDDTYKKVIDKIHEDKVCPFCPDNLEKYHKNPIIKQTEFWTLTTNMYPYKNSKYHFLLILKNHKNNTHELSPEEWSEIHTHTDWLASEYKLLGGTFIMRCGDTSHTGASVTHLHAHFISPDFENPNREPVMVKIG